MPGVPASAITVYWRPGCPFCSGLLRSMERHGLEPELRNIWEDEDAAAFVRSVARGNETVPTVSVGDHALVNPTVDDVMAVLAEVAPAEVPDGWEPATPGPVARFVSRVLGG
jgi:mycoredoxin